MCRKPLALIALFVSVLMPLRAADTVLITEFMASNSSTLADEDGAFSDWVEIYNAGTNTVNLGGWYLTDDAANLTKWQFPATNMAPNTFMIVFCSNKDRRIPGRPLHTSFALGAAGEYLALVRPDGTTVASGFAPEFPNQFNDVAYGFVMTGTSTTLLPSGAPARALVPSSDIGATWRGTNYNDSTWTSGTTGAGYDQGTNYTPAIGLDLGAAMSNVNASAYLRVPFNVTDPGLFKALTLRMRYDDGFVAYLNGTEIARRNAPAVNEWNSTATANHGPPSPGALIENFEGGNSQYTVHQYGAPLGPVPTNQPAGAGSTGRFFRLLYDGNNGAFNSLAFRQTAAGLFQTIVADFDFRMMNSANNPADGWAFMLIPTKTYGTNGPGVNTQPQGIEEPNFPGVFSVGVDVYPHGTQNDVSVHWNAGEKANVTMPRPAYELVNNQFHHMKVTLEHVPGGARVTVTLTFNINGTPSAPYTPVENLFVAGLDAYDCRVQFAARTGGLNHGLDFDNLNVQFMPPPGLIAFEDFDVTPGLAALAPGANVLAIQGLNLTASDKDFLISPELVGADFALTSAATYIAPATPGTWNNVAGAGTLADVTFSLPAGAYTSNSLSVALASSSSSAQIRYTLNGATPTSSSPLYTGPITITSNTVVRARAFEAGKVDSEITAANYVLIDPALTNFTSNLPLVIIDTMGGTVVAETKIPSYMVFIDTNGPAGRTRFNGPFDFTGRAGVELHGQSSLGFPKQSMNVEVNSEKDKDRDASLLGMPPGSDWVLYAPYTDKTFMNDFLAYELHEAMGHYAVRRKYVEVFLRSTAGKLSTNDYRGIFVLLEKIRISVDRVDIDEPQSGAPGDPITGGYIWKRDKPSPVMYEFTTPSQPYTAAANGVSMQFHHPRGEDLNPAQLAWLPAYLTQFENALYGPNFRDPLYGYLSYVDVDSFVDQQWIVEFPKQIDGYRLSNYMYKDRDGKIKMEPIWDWNLAWGNANYLEGGYTNGWYYPLLGGGDDMWLNRLRADPDFNQRVADRWGQLRTNIFALPNLIARINRITNQLAEAQLRDFARWPRLGTEIWPNPNGAQNGTPIAGRNWNVNFVAPTTYAGIIQQQKNWVTGRHMWVESQFLIPPTISKAGGFVVPGTALTITGALGSIYYTMDGTDPRASGGGISPSAILYSGGNITVSNNAGVFARSFYTNRWSAPARETYVIATPSLAITEIMYHPADAPTNSPYEESDFEYIEIKNTGSSAINLQGARLAGGIDFTFLPSALIPVGTPTSNSFNGNGTSFTASTLNNPGAPDGDGQVMRLIHGGSTNLVRNRIAFDQTASGNYGRVTADFDFRATTVSAVTSNGAPTLQDFEGGAGTTNYALSGAAVVRTNDAGSTGSFLRLVPPAASLTGGAGFTRTAPGPWNTVVATFDFRITPGAGQADGMSVAFLNTTTYGTNGPAPGMSEEPNLSGSIGIGLDVYNNAEINNNHVSLHYGSIVGAPVTPSFDLSNGRFHRAQIVIRFTGGRALLTLRITPDVNVAPGPAVILFQDAVINGVNPYEMRLAFGARTGGENAAHDVDNVSVQYMNENNTAAGLSLVMLPTATFGTTGAGSTLAHFTDAPTLTNGLSLDLVFHPSNYVNDVALYWNAARVVGAFVPPGAIDFDSGSFHHAHMVIDTYAGGAYLTAILTPNSLGTPGTPIVLFSNLFLAGVSPGNWRVELAGRNGLVDTTLDVENVNVNFEAFSSLLLAPGECILVVKNRAAFESRYGTGFRIAGEFSGQLNNAGDHIVLLGPVGEHILDFTYSDDWYRLTDGLGFSLVNVNPTAPNSSYSSETNWRNSTHQDGSPGEADPVLDIAPIVVNEVLANSQPPDVDRIELFNPTTNAVNIGGWYLTDDFAEPKKFRIPLGTLISSTGFVVFSEADFNSPPGSETSFAISSDGDEVYLFSGDTNGNLTGYVHGFDFGAAEEGVSFGRYVDGFGEDHFPAQWTNTFGAVNAGPRVGPIVIGEINYRPPDVNGLDNDLDEYIEIANIGPDPVPLYSTALPTDTWRLRSAVEFDFPQNVTLASGEHILVVSFDPTNATLLADFRAKYNVNPTVRVFGPWSGKLDNSGDNIHLNKPLPPGANETIYVRADNISYRDSAPWNPVADGYGASLGRMLLYAYGNDPAHWRATVPSAGIPSNPGLNNEPVIITHPTPATLVGGQSTNFFVTASGPNLRYQWRANGTNIVGSTNSTLVLNDVQVTQAGDYYVAVFNEFDSSLSGPVQLTVIAPVLFTLQPANQFVLPGTNVTLTAAATGGGPVTYQWRFTPYGGSPTDISGATNASYSFTGASLSHHGHYSVVGSDGFTSTESSSAFIYVMVRPGFSVQPTPVVVAQGGTAVFTVVATGAPPLYYRWIRNGQGILTSSVPILVINNVPLASPNPMPIRCAVTNQASGAGGVNSLTVQMLVQADADGDGIGDAWETNYAGFSTNSAADGALDFDGDGASNHDEYVAATDPTNPLSVLKLALNTINPGVPALEFTAQSNLNYSVQYRTNLALGGWLNLSNVPGLINATRTIQVTAPNPPPNWEQYYRVATPAVP